MVEQLDQDTKKWLIVAWAWFFLLLSLIFWLLSYFRVQSVQWQLLETQQMLDWMSNVYQDLEKLQSSVTNFDAIIADLQENMETDEEVSLVTTEQLANQISAIRDEISSIVEERVVWLEWTVNWLGSTVWAHWEVIRQNRATLDRFSEVIILDRE